MVNVLNTFSALSGVPSDANLKTTAEVVWLTADSDILKRPVLSPSRVTLSILMVAVTFSSSLSSIIIVSEVLSLPGATVLLKITLISSLPSKSKSSTGVIDNIIVLLPTGTPTETGAE